MNRIEGGEKMLRDRIGEDEEMGERHRDVWRLHRLEQMAASESVYLERIHMDESYSDELHRRAREEDFEGLDGCRVLY